jgi:hypothetical protein
MILIFYFHEFDVQVISSGQVLAAVYKAISAELLDKLRLKSLFAEIIFNLASNNNVNDCFN